MRARVVAQIIHTHALPHVHAANTVRQPHAKQPHPAVGTCPAVMAIQAAVRAAPAHLDMFQGCQLDRLGTLYSDKEKQGGWGVVRNKRRFDKMTPQIPLHLANARAR